MSQGDGHFSVSGTKIEGIGQRMSQGDGHFSVSGTKIEGIGYTK